ncbi:pentapeptide repeat-containing protein [Actinoallomurus rhizosphaericola]|uniref:pentapeptide repeat-containing protein n=1 Tax=Actinoallomurus rhizosphaericola TaxID=2952536 RepID=UPI002093CB74|nr:pentapeptide repeat-containing protein [Actinoallomurus rhizosphaericola]MCO5997584.1 pentapeptide repeat-containing protein [Actinoallomurus rhizosphaericola]
MAERKHGRPAPPIESTVRSEDWDGRDLSGEEHTRVEFVDVDLTETSGRGAVFTECVFRAVRFNVSSYTDAAFINCTFVRCSFFDATLTGCKLVGSVFDGCTYGLFTVEGGDWSFTGLPGADLRGSSFRRVRMREADLTGARLQKASFRDVDLSGAWLQKADLSECDLRGSDLSSLDPHATSLTRAVIDPYQAIVIAQALGLEVKEA